MSGEDKKVVTLGAIADKVRGGDDSDKLADAGIKPGSEPPNPESSGDSYRGLADDTRYPEDSPVQPLGTKDGEFHFLDARGSHRIMTAGKFDQAHIEDLFSPRTPLLPMYWPHIKDGVVTGWAGRRARPSLMNAASRAGQFDPSKKLRGLGAWIDDKGNLVFHAGKKLHFGKKKVDPGFVDGYLYPRRAPSLVPGNANEAASACDFMMTLLKSWNFERGHDAARLAFGHAVTQLVCGALDFRPAIYFTGDAGSGKTTLLKVFEGFSGMLMASDATPAGVYQTVRDNALPVGLDETEPDMDLRKQKAMLALMRSSASGGMILRGSGEHRSVEFTARSSFVFGSITPLQMSRADLSRMPMIEIGPATGKLPAYTKDELREAGSAILARFLSDWPAFQARLALWSEAMREAGHDPRGVDAYATLLAAADFAEADNPPSPEDLREEVSRFAVTSVDADGGEKQGELCLRTIFGHRAALDGEARRFQISELLRQMWEDVPDDDQDAIDQRNRHKRFDRTLRQYGLAVFSAIKKDPAPKDMLPILMTRKVDRPGCWLAIANRHTGLIEAFKDTTWQTDPSSAMSGWYPTLKRLTDAPFHAAPSANSIKFSGQQSRATLVRIDHLFGED